MKKYIRVLLLAALVCSLLAGCSIETKSSKDSQDESKYHLYYLNESETVLREEPYSPGEETADFMVKDLMQKLGSKDAPDGEISLLPEDVSINSYEVQKDLLVIDFSKEYSKMSKIREVMTRDGVVQTFLQIPDIHKVQFTVGGQPLTNSRNQEVGEMTSDTFAQYTGKDKESYRYDTFTLYFTDKNGKNLVKETRNVYYRRSLPKERVVLEQLAKGLAPEHHDRAANAIMTTDTFPKEYAVTFTAGGKKCTIGGMAKGSGMIHPNMATTLNFVTTDAAISTDLIQKALSEIVKVTYNCLSIDGDTSTNDMVCILANGLAGNEEITTEGEDYKAFSDALYQVLMSLTKMLAKDGEGASKMLECTCAGAPDQDTAIIVAKSVIRSPLFKCAMFGEDANWGRILCAIGYAEAEFDIDKVAVDLASAKGTIAVCRDGSGVEFSEEKAKEVLGEDEIYINIDLHQGDASAKAWGCDLTYDYVKINGDYRS